MSTLFELAQPIYDIKHELDSMLEDGIITEQEAAQVFNDNIQILQMPIQEKITNLINWQKDDELSLETLKEQKEKINKMLDAKIKSKENRIKSIKEYIINGMKMANIDKIKSDLFSATLTHSQSCKIVNEDKLKQYIIDNGLEETYIRRKVTEDFNKVEIGKALKAGRKVDGCELETKDGLRIG